MIKSIWPVYEKSSKDSKIKGLKQIKTKVHSCNILLNIGHVIDANGVHAAQSKITAIQEAPVPTNLTQLRAFLGLVNYYNKFFPFSIHSFKFGSFTSPIKQPPQEKTKMGVVSTVHTII